MTSLKEKLGAVLLAASMAGTAQAGGEDAAGITTVPGKKPDYMHHGDTTNKAYTYAIETTPFPPQPLTPGSKDENHPRSIPFTEVDTWKACSSGDHYLTVDVETDFTVRHNSPEPLDEERLSDLFHSVHFYFWKATQIVFSSYEKDKRVDVTEIITEDPNKFAKNFATNILPGIQDYTAKALKRYFEGNPLPAGTSAAIEEGKSTVYIHVTNEPAPDLCQNGKPVDNNSDSSRSFKYNDYIRMGPNPMDI